MRSIGTANKWLSWARHDARPGSRDHRARAVENKQRRRREAGDGHRSCVLVAGAGRCGQVKISPVPPSWLVSPCCSRIVTMSRLARPQTTGNGAPLTAEDMLGCPFPRLLLTATVTATAATNGHRQRSATAHNTRTIRANWGYARPEKRTVHGRRTGQADLRLLGATGTNDSLRFRTHLNNGPERARGHGTDLNEPGCLHRNLRI
jgi:hypothetical protein